MRPIIVIALAWASTSAIAQQPWTLEQCLQRAEAKNLDLRDATLQAQLAEEGRDQAKWALLPDLNGGATHGYNFGQTVDRYTNTFATDRVRTNNLWLSSNWMLFEGLRRQNELKQGHLNADAATKGLDASRNTVRATVVRQFLDILNLRERIKSAEAQTSSSRAQVERMTALVDAGRNPRADLLDLESQLARGEVDLVDLQNQEEQSLLQLAQSLQLTYEEMQGFDVSAPSVMSIAITEPTATPESMLPAVLATDPAYAQADLQAQSMSHGVAIARSGTIPSLSLGGSLGSGYSGLNSIPIGEPITGAPNLVGFTESGENVYTPNITYNTEVKTFGTQLEDNFNKSVNFTLMVPLFNNRRNHYAIQQAQVQYEQAKVSVDRQHDRALRDVQDALVQQRSAYRSHVAASRAVTASEEAMRYAQERFERGVITAVEMDLARTNLVASTADLITAKYNWLMAAKLLDILQGLPLTL